MSTVQASPDIAPAVCPNCGRTPSATSTRSEAGTTIGDYRCADGHIWTTRWLVTA